MPSVDRIAEILERNRMNKLTVYNTTMTNANTEYSQVIPSTARLIVLSIQDGVSTDNFRISNITGKVATPTAPYLKYAGNVSYSVTNCDLSDNFTFYFACSASGKVMQIEIWE
jgi:hypothetical protein